MDKNEILEAAKNSHDELGEYEKSVSGNGFRFSIMVCVLICVVVGCIEVIFAKKIDLGMISLLFVFYGVPQLYEGVVLKNKRVLIVGIISCVLAAILLITHMGVIFR